MQVFRLPFQNHEPVAIIHVIQNHFPGRIAVYTLPVVPGSSHYAFGRFQHSHYSIQFSRICRPDSKQFSNIHIFFNTIKNVPLSCQRDVIK